MLRLLKILSLALMLPVAAEAAVNVVVIAPQEGEYQHFGRELADGVKMAAADLNARGGILGEPINVIVADDRCEDTFAVSMAQMMSVNTSAKDKVRLVIGPFCRNEFDKASAIYAKAGIMQIVPVPVNGSAKSDFLKIAGLRKEQSKVFFDYYQHHLPGQNTALVYDAQNRGLTDIAAEIQQNFMENNCANRLTSYNFANYGKDYTRMAQEILLNNQVVYILGASKETAKLTRELKEQKNDTVIFTDRYQLNQSYGEIIGDLAEGCYYLGLKNFKDSPYFTETLVNLRLQGLEPVGLGVYGFSALKLWGDIAEKAKSFNYAALNKAVSGGEFVMPWGAMSFKNSSFFGTPVYGVFKRQGGEYTQVY